MKTLNFKVAAVIAALAIASGAAPRAFAQEETKKFEASVLGGVQGIMGNDSAIKDDFVNVPLAAALAYHVNTIFAVEGEFQWLIPVQNSVSIGSGATQDLTNPDVLSYQANLRAGIPVGGASLSPYVTAGAGAMTFLSATDPDNYPQLDKSQTAFAVNFGLGTMVPVTNSLSLRADFREFVAFPKDDATGISNGTSADAIWMPRGTVGVAYRF